MQRIVVSVTNDLVSDQRVHKICSTLHTLGYDVVLIGRKHNISKPIYRNYKTKRIKLFFNQGFLFYAEYTIRLFFLHSVCQVWGIRLLSFTKTAWQDVA